MTGGLLIPFLKSKLEMEIFEGIKVMKETKGKRREKKITFRLHEALAPCTYTNAV